MSWIGATMLVVGFLIAIRVFDLMNRSRMVFQESARALAIIRRKDLTEVDKEKQLQRHALRLFGLFAFLVLGGGAGVAAPLAVVVLLEQVGWMKVGPVMARVVSLEFITISTVVIGLVLFVFRKSGRHV